MADVLMIAGKPETIFKARDFEYLVEKHMGYEAAKYFREYAEKADEEVRSAKAGENTDPFRTFRRKPQLSRVFFKKNG